MRKPSLMLLATAIIGLGASQASAADLPRKAPAYVPPAPPPFSWTGCYVGANIGAGWQKNRPLDPLLPIDLGDVTDTGIVGGGQIGCDYQFAGSGFVVGFQGMFDGAGINGSAFLPFAYAGDTTMSYAFKTDWFGTLTGRAGYAVMLQALLYIKGGGAWVHTKNTNADPSGTFYPPYEGTASVTRSGWLIGAGLEYAFWRNWSVFVEYNYIDLGNRNLSLTYDCGGSCGFANPYTFQDKQTLQTVLVGVNWRFGGL